MSEKKKKLTYFQQINNLLNKGIHNLSDLITLGRYYEKYIQYEFIYYEFDDSDNEEYFYEPSCDFLTNINLDKLTRILSPLEELNNMIGMNNIKETLCYQLLYFLQGLNDSNDYYHSVIYGNPGVGKTTVVKILGDIYKKLGILSKGFVKHATKDVLIAEYVGQTAIKTRKFLDSCIGGIMLLDEAYQISSGSLDKGDSFSKECIDMINQFLLEHRQDFICLLAGYKDDIEKCFFSLNKGLERRFPWRFEINDYKPNELEHIFISQIKESKWEIEKDAIPNDFFEKNKKVFKNNGGDTEILFNKIKISHSFRITNCEKSVKKKINKEDIEKGMEMYISTENIKKRIDEDQNDKIPFMYS
jgi:replication-associated recombination protein RarA